jgi:ribosomal small subunit protein bTHX
MVATDLSLRRLDLRGSWRRIPVKDHQSLGHPARGTISSHQQPASFIMGKGDKKTRRGKIRRSSYGKSRKRVSKKKGKAPARAS